MQSFTFMHNTYVVPPDVSVIVRNVREHRDIVDFDFYETDSWKIIPYLEWESHGIFLLSSGIKYEDLK